MIDSRSDIERANVPVGRSRWIHRGILAATCVLVIGVYAYTARSGYLVSTSLNPAGEYYNLLVEGFRAGQLSLKKEVPAGFAQLADPYDPTANAPYGLLDLSYYRGKLYLYYGVTPALALFWPYITLTGHYLSQKDATMIFCVIGFLASTGLLCALWQRYFGNVSVGLVATGVIALGFASFMPFLLARCDVYEVSISCGYMLTMLALAAIWKALHDLNRSWQWLAAASLAYGLALGARPSLLFGAVILLVPVAQAWRERRKVRLLLIAATGPLVLIGLGLMLYNALRFDNPLEFGMGYGLGGDRLHRAPFFGLRYLWFHFKVYCLEPARWDGRFPFVHDITVPPLPPGHGRVEHPFGILTNIPLVWLALAAPLAGRGRPTESRRILRSILTVLGLLFATCLLTLSLYFSASGRYEAEFLPSLVLLAVIGILSLERAFVLRGAKLTPTSESGWTVQMLRRPLIRWGWGTLLGFSVAFNLLASVGRTSEAHYNLGYVLERMGRVTEAITQYKQALRLNPEYAEAHRILGNHLLEAGEVSEAITHYEETVRLDPARAEAHNNLGVALVRLGRLPEAVEHFRQALRINPNLADCHSNLAVALMRLGKESEALNHFERSLQLRPEDAETHYDFAVALEQAGQIPEAIGHYEQALRLKPDFDEAQKALARLRAAQ